MKKSMLLLLAGFPAQVLLAQLTGFVGISFQAGFYFYIGYTKFK